MSKVEVSLILPCFNEGSTFESSVELILRELKKSLFSWEIIFVEDKSTDDTKASIEKFINRVKNCRTVYHRRNEGRGKSVKDGILKSRGSICGFMDVDCEISPQYIPLFIDEVRKGFEVVVAQRFYENNLRSLNRVIASRLYSTIVKLTLDIPVKDTEAGYKFFNRAAIIPVIKQVCDKRWFWDTEVCARASLAGLKISELPVLFKKRQDKKSTVRLIPDSLEYLKRLLKFKSQLSREKK